MGGIIFHAAARLSSVSSDVSNGRNKLAVDENKLLVKNHRRYHPFENNGPYTVLYKIGEGAFSECRLALHKKTLQKVVIKHIHLDYVLPQYKSSIQNEFNILSQLKHPNIVGLFEVYSIHGDYFMITEYLSGGELFDAICEREIYLEEDARKVMLCMTQAIFYCHSHGVMHRDIKPENLILATKSSPTTVKLIDFGFACVVDNGKDLPCDLRGTPYYLAPEVIKQIPYSKPADIWSLGCILHLMLVGTLPFESHDIDKLYRLIQIGNLSLKRSMWDQISSSAIDLVLKMLTVHPDERLTAEQVLSHPWLSDTSNRDISTSLVQMKIWQQNRKLKATAVAVRSTVAFTKAGARFRRGLLKSAQEAKQLEDAGIDWKLSSAEIKSELEKKTVISSKKYLAVTDHSQLTYSASMSENQEKECSLNSA